MIYLEPKINFENTTGKMIVELERVFDINDIARMFDVPLKKVKQKHAAALTAIEDERAGQTKNYNVFDLDVAMLKILKMLEKYLDPDYVPENEDAMLKIIDRGDSLLKTFSRMKKEIDEFMKTREMMRIVINAIKSSHDAEHILARLISDRRLKTLL